MTLQPFARGTEGLLNLAKMLEDEQAWRDKLMIWNFNEILEHTEEGCGSVGCALGLAAKAWPEFMDGEDPYKSSLFSRAERVFEISGCVSSLLFAVGSGTDYDVTPGEVAKRIRDYLLEKTTEESGIK